MSKKYTTQFEKMTQMPVQRLVLLLGAPTTISMLVTTFYSMADTYFVGKLGTSATGAIGILFPLMGVIQAIGFMFGQGAGSNISRLLGAKDPEEASNYGSMSFYFCLCSGILMTALGLIFIDPLMRVLGSSDTILPFARTYGIFILCAIPAMMCSFVLNNILRFEGRASLAMVGLVLGGFLNVLGDWLAISVMGMGIEGAGIATMLSNYVSMGLLLSNFIRKKTSTRLQLRRIFRRAGQADVHTAAEPAEETGSTTQAAHVADNENGGSSAATQMNGKTTTRRHRLVNIILTGLPSLARQGMSSIATMSMNWMAVGYGDAAVAAMSIVMRLTFMLYAVGLGIGQGFQPVSGFNYGAGLYGRVRGAAYFTWGFGTVLLTGLAVGAWFISEDLVQIFRDDPEVLSVGVPALRYQLLSIPLVPIGFMGNMLFQSIGKSGRALFLSCLRSGICYIPVLFVCGTAFGLLGIQIAQPVSDALTACITLPFLLSFLHKLGQNSL